MTKCLPALLVGAWMCTGLALTYGADGSTNAYQAGPSGDHRTRLSFHNRLLLNRVVLARLPTIEVMLAVRGTAMPTIVRHVERLAGRVVRSDNAVGYLRVEIPTARFLDLDRARGHQRRHRGVSDLHAVPGRVVSRRAAAEGRRAVTRCRDAGDGGTKSTSTVVAAARFRRRRRERSATPLAKMPASRPGWRLIQRLTAVA